MKAVNITLGMFIHFDFAHVYQNSNLQYLIQHHEIRLSYRLLIRNGAAKTVFLLLSKMYEQNLVEALERCLSFHTISDDQVIMVISLATLSMMTMVMILAVVTARQAVNTKKKNESQGCFDINSEESESAMGEETDDTKTDEAREKLEKLRRCLNRSDSDKQAAFLLRVLNYPEIFHESQNERGEGGSVKIPRRGSMQADTLRLPSGSGWRTHSLER